MQLLSNHLYHIYNQGNNREQLFYNRDNYLHFIHKVRNIIKPHCKIMAWCLMPNHFHFLIGTTPASVKKARIGSLEMTQLGKAFRTMESSYAQAINKQLNRSGSLFRQKTQAKCLTEEAFDFDNPTQILAPDFFNLYPIVCFNYIHQNPVKARLVTKMENWEFSSFQDYISVRNGTLCDYDLCRRWVGLREIDLYRDSIVPLKDEDVTNIFT
jgi:putative transposase